MKIVNRSKNVELNLATHFRFESCKSDIPAGVKGTHFVNKKTTEGTWLTF